MMKDFFAAVVLGVAVCMVTWGSAPVLLATDVPGIVQILACCKDIRDPHCEASAVPDIDVDNVGMCTSEAAGDACGKRTTWQTVRLFNVVPIPWSVTIPCGCMTREQIVPPKGTFAGYINRRCQCL